MKKTLLALVCVALLGAAAALLGPHTAFPAPDGADGSASQSLPSSGPQQGSSSDTSGSGREPISHLAGEGIFSAHYQRAAELLAGMPLEARAGQVLLARCPRFGGAAAAEKYQLGGYVLFGRDFDGKSAQQVRSAVASYQQASDIPMLMAVDEEGGDIVRISSKPLLSGERFGSPQQVYAAGGLEGVRTDALKKAALLSGLGLNLNLGPVCDVTQSDSDYIYTRTFGLDAAGTGAGVSAAVQGMREGGVLSALKHFPGYGNNLNTHTGIAHDGRPYDQFLSCDLLPFEDGVRAGAECVLVSHVIVECMDPDVPASLSPEVHRVLREEVGFTGVVMTDDLSMDAITDYTGGQSPAVQALAAGNDLLIVTDYAEAHAAVVEAVRSGALDEATLDRAVQRVLALKLACGLLK